MILRKKLTQGYTKIPNDTLNDATISYGALGVLCSVLSKPDGWEVKYRGLERGPKRPGREGKSPTLRYLRELENAGYIRRVRTRDANGRITSECTVSDAPVPEWLAEAAKPQVAPCGAKPEHGSPEHGFPERIGSTEVVRTKEEALPSLRSEEPGAGLTSDRGISPAGLCAEGAVTQNPGPGPRVDASDYVTLSPHGKRAALYHRGMDHALGFAPQWCGSERTRDLLRDHFAQRQPDPYNPVAALLVALDARHGSGRVALARLTEHKLHAPAPATPERDTYDRLIALRDLLQQMDRVLGAEPPPAPDPVEADLDKAILAGLGEGLFPAEPGGLPDVRVRESDPEPEEPVTPEPVTCPLGHDADDLMYLETESGGSWPMCLTCLGMPRPEPVEDTATWHPEMDRDR